MPLYGAADGFHGLMGRAFHPEQDPGVPACVRLEIMKNQGVDVAIVLLLAGGLAALQTASIVSAFPFMIVMIFMCIALVKGFRNEFEIGT